MLLKNLNVLITRPLEQGQSLAEKITQKGGGACFFPTIEIKSVLNESVWVKKLLELKETTDFFIFVSRNAVAFSAPYLSTDISPILAIGPGTESALMQKGFVVKNRPDYTFNTESLLNLPELQCVENQNILIFSGENSRPLLSSSLEARGANVTMLEVYRRVCPETLPTFSFLKAIDIVVTTSLEGLKNWSILIGESGRQYCRNIPLVVISKSMQEEAARLELGYPILVANDATDESLIAALGQWVNWS